MKLRYRVAVMMAGLMFGVSFPAQETTPLNLVDAPGHSNTPVLSSDASDPLTKVSMADTAVGLNLLGSNGTFTPAAPGSPGYAYDDGTALQFAGQGRYDPFTQTAYTAVGSSYTGDSLSTNSHATELSGLLATTRPVSAVPEPSTWAMMILGFAGVVFMAYKRRQCTLA